MSRGDLLCNMFLQIDRIVYSSAIFWTRRRMISRRLTVWVRLRTMNSVRLKAVSVSLEDVRMIELELE